MMLYRLVERLSSRFVARGACDPDDADSLTYGLFSLLSDVIQILVLTFTALLFDIVPGMLAFCAFYVSLRRSAGGAHASSQIACLILFTLLALTGTLLGMRAPLSLARTLSLFPAVLSVLVVFLRAPVTHPDFPRKEGAVKRFRRGARVTVIIQATLIITGSIAAPTWALPYILCAALGSGFVALTLLVPVRTNEKKEE